MLQSKLFSKTSKETPKEELSINARLLEQAGYVQKVMAGVYNFLPLGNRVLTKIENIIRQEMDSVGVELLMPALQPKENWITTGRWDSVEVLFKLKSAHGFEYALGATHEEIITPAAKKSIHSYRDLPLAVYQIQTKFRDEARAKSGLLRGREFRMKDLYSFHTNQDDLNKYYDQVAKTYMRLFKRLGLMAIYTEASGGSFSKYSHEFQVEVATGEDTIFICNQCNLAKNKEIFKGTAENNSELCTNCGKTSWRQTQACEVGNIFKLGTRFSEPNDLKYLDKDGKAQYVIMGCYGIGTTRLMGVLAELYNDQYGLMFPENIAPFKVHLLSLPAKNNTVQTKVYALAKKVYSDLQKNGVEVLLDNRAETAGSKFKDSDLIGIPYRIVVSEKTLLQKKFELKQRKNQKPKLIPFSKLVPLLK